MRINVKSHWLQCTYHNYISSSFTVIFYVICDSTKGVFHLVVLFMCNSYISNNESMSLWAERVRLRSQKFIILCTFYVCIFWYVVVYGLSFGVYISDCKLRLCTIIFHLFHLVKFCVKKFSCEIVFIYQYNKVKFVLV